MPLLCPRCQRSEGIRLLLHTPYYHAPQYTCGRCNHILDGDEAASPPASGALINRGRRRREYGPDR